MNTHRFAVCLLGPLLLLLQLPAGAQPVPVAPPASAAPAAPALPAQPPEPPAVEGRSYAPGEFDTIEISGAAHVRFRQGESESVFVEGDEAAQKALTLEVRSGQLYIRPAGSWKFWNTRRINVNVTARDLKRVNISGAADLLATLPVALGRLQISISGSGVARFDQLKAEQLNFHVSGSGDGQMAGQVDQLEVRVSGRSDFRGAELMAQRARVRVSGLADVKVWAVQELAVTVSGVGTVDYYGSPVVQRNTSGIARLNARGAKTPP